MSVGSATCYVLRKAVLIIVCVSNIDRVGTPEDTLSVCRLAYKLWGDGNYVQKIFLSHSERVRLDGMQLGPVLAKVAVTSTRH